MSLATFPRFCGEQARQGGPYCAKHHARAYLRPGARSDDPADAAPQRVVA